MNRWILHAGTLQRQVAAELTQFSRHHPEVRVILLHATVTFWINQNGQPTRIDFLSENHDLYGESLIRNDLLKEIHLDRPLERISLCPSG